MRDGEFSDIMQQQEEDEEQKLMEKEQRSMTSTSTGEDLLLFQRVLSQHHSPKYYIPQNLGIASKITTLTMDSIFFFADCLLQLQAVFRVSGGNATVDVGWYSKNPSSLGMICTNVLMNSTERITNRATTIFLASLTMISSIQYVLYTTISLVPHFVILTVKN